MAQRRFDAPERQSLTSHGVKRRNAAGFEMLLHNYLLLSELR
jgi:hypothetical protein